MIATSCPKMTVDLMCRSFSADAPNMVRSACGSTEYNVVARTSARDGELPSDQGADLQAPKIALSVKGETPTITTFSDAGHRTGGAAPQAVGIRSPSQQETHAAQQTARHSLT